MFQSPSLRGSGRFATPSAELHGSAQFQSPSLRGSGRFRPSSTATTSPWRCFNPLHCGAVVASSGSGGRMSRPSSSFNPLHCGAVVASSSPRRSSPWRSWRFNPLHCGAVVASRDAHLIVPDGDLVSIPFIAGQWSLPGVCGHEGLRCLPVSIPFIAGQWSLLLKRLRHVVAEDVSIPFIAGQWSLREAAARAIAEEQVSIPFIAGQWSLLWRAPDGSVAAILVSIPFIAGQWSLPRSRGASPRVSSSSFNPLHCGAVVASLPRKPQPHGSTCFNPLHCGAVVASRYEA